MYDVYKHDINIQYNCIGGSETMSTALSDSPIEELEITLPNSQKVMSGNVLGEQIE